MTIVWYTSSGNYRSAVLFNAFAFGVTSIEAQSVLGRYYRPLIRRDPRHRLLLQVWLFVYAPVGIQMGWMLQPFISAAALPPQFLREHAVGNAYVRLAQVIWGVFGG